MVCQPLDLDNPTATKRDLWEACTERAKGMYNGAILGVPRRIDDEVEERELIRKGLSSLI